MENLVSHIPSKYRCAITHQIMIDPVMAADGHTYEREAIEAWLTKHDTSPKTNEQLEDKKLRANHDKRSDILDFLDSHPELYEGSEVYLPRSWIEQCAVSIKQNQLPEVQRLLDKDRRLLTSMLENDATALVLACEFSSPELVDMLLNRLERRFQKVSFYPQDLNRVHLNVLFVRALENDEYRKCELLLKLGAKIEQQDASGTLLHRVVVEGKLGATSWLLEKKADLERRNSEGNTPLLLSVLYNHKPLVEFLLTMNADPKSKNNKQQSAISVAVLERKLSLLPLLIGQEKAALSHLHLGLVLGDNALIKTLLEQKPIDCLEALDEKHRTPILSAVESGNLEVVKLLVEAGASPKVKNEMSQYNVLHVAVRQRDEAMLRYLLETSAIDLLDAQDARGDTPLHLATRDEDLILLLLQAGAYPKIKNLDDQTPLELARAQNFETWQFMLQSVRDIKKSKSREMARLQQIVAEQTLEMRSMKVTIEKLQERLSLIEFPESKESKCCVSIHANSSVVPLHVSQKVPEFLRLVAEGEQDKAEAMLKAEPVLALLPGQITDLSNRIFREVTGFQYAVWALDWHMWTMLLKYVPFKQAQEQMSGMEKSRWAAENKIHAGWILEELLNALQVYVDKHWRSGDMDQRKQYWAHKVGRIKRSLPAHVVNEYCYLYPSHFNSDYDFTEPRSAGKWRTRNTKEGEWFDLCQKQIERVSAVGVASLNPNHILWWVEWRSSDHAVILSLLNTRKRQRESLLAQLLS